jgi:rhamnosyltransferase subunit B
MKMLIAVLGSAGDVYPSLGIAVELRARGHDVRLVANPWFEDAIRREGIGFVPMGTVEDYRRSVAEADLWHPRRAFGVIVRHGVAPAQAIVHEAILEARPDVVAATSLAIGARTARDALGIPLVTLHVQPSILRSIEDPPRVSGLPMPAWWPRSLVRGAFRLADALAIDPVLGPPLNAHRRSLGLAPVARPLMDWMHSPDRVLGLFPDWFAPPPADWPASFRATGFVGFDGTAAGGRLASEVERFLDAGPPPVVITPGSANAHGRRFLEGAVAACAAMGRRGLVLTPYGDQVPRPLPPGVMHAPSAPFAALLPRAAALVHHGGIGTMAQALAAGIPQLVMPMAHDQPDNAARAQRLGVASWIAPRSWTASRIAPALERLLGDPAVADACRELAPRVSFDASRRLAAAEVEAVGGRATGPRRTAPPT